MFVHVLYLLQEFLIKQVSRNHQPRQQDQRKRLKVIGIYDFLCCTISKLNPMSILWAQFELGSLKVLEDHRQIETKGNQYKRFFKELLTPVLDSVTKQLYGNAIVYFG